MERRCVLLENSPQLQYLQRGPQSVLTDEKKNRLENIDATHMRSTIFEIMKEEVEDFCKNSILDSSHTHQQVHYFLCYLLVNA